MSCELLLHPCGKPMAKYLERGSKCPWIHEFRRSIHQSTCRKGLLLAAHVPGAPQTIKNLAKAWFCMCMREPLFFFIVLRGPGTYTYIIYIYIYHQLNTKGPLRQSSPCFSFPTLPKMSKPSQDQYCIQTVAAK